jgi:SulP family sulfate permease
MRTRLAHFQWDITPSRLLSADEIRRNIISGLVVGTIALPLSIALAIAVGAPPIMGLYTAAFAGAAASIFGSSKFNITGPTAALVPLISAVVIKYGIEALPLLGIMAAAILVVMSLLRLGRAAKFIPGVVVAGFTVGIALSIAFGQLNSLLGVTGTDPDLEHFHERLWDTLTHLGTVGWTTIVIGTASVALVYLWPRVNKRVPGALVAVILFTAIVWPLSIDTTTVAGKYGELPKGLPEFSLPDFDSELALELLPSAFAVAVLAGVETLLSAVVADNMANVQVRHNSDRELFGQGVANLVSAVAGGIPATAAIARTGAGVQNGATSRVSGVVHSIFVFLCTIALASLVGHVPLAVLAGVLMVTAYRIADLPALKRIYRGAPRSELLVLVLTIGLTVFLDLTYAILAGVVISVVLVLRQLSSAAAAAQMGPNEQGLIRQVSPQLGELIKSRPDIAFYNAQGILSFHSAAGLERALLVDEPRPLILRMKDVSYVDTSGLMALEHIIHERKRKGRRVVLSAVQPQVLPRIKRFGLLADLGWSNLFPSTASAIASIPAPAASVDATTSRPAPKGPVTAH